MFRVKICGVRSAADVQAVADSGADAIGLNFYEQSVRHVTLGDASSLVCELSETVAPVGVFVNHSLDFIEHAADQIGLRFIQLHGDEPLSMISDLGGARVIRALRLKNEGSRLIHQFVDEIVTLGELPAAVLIESHVADQFGGTGSTMNWSTLDLSPFDQAGIKTILAGGLRPANVATAISQARPWGVDTASGVESSPGVKDSKLIQSFVSEARKTFAN